MQSVHAHMRARPLLDSLDKAEKSTHSTSDIHWFVAKRLT